MKHQFIEANTLEDAWYLTLYRMIDEGRVYKIDRGSFAGQKRLEFDYVTIQIKNPGLGNLVPSIPEGHSIDPPVAQGYCEDYSQQYLMGHELADNESYTYGQRMTKYPISHPIEHFKNDRNKDIIIQEIDTLIELGIIMKEYTDVKEMDRQGIETTIQTLPVYYLNQIELVIWLYNNKGHRNNQTVIDIAHPTDLLLQDPPCLRQIQVRIQDGKLHFFVYFRSWDLWNGFPANLGGIQIMKQYMVEMIDGVEDGEIIATSGGLHVYDYVFDIAKVLSMKDEVILKMGN
jgi:thymidylate synthase